MSLQDIPNVENAKFYINLAFKRANEKAKIARERVSKERRVLDKSKIVEIEKMRAVRDYLDKVLDSIVSHFPSLGQLTRFYRELIECYVDIDELKKSLGAMNWAANKINDFFIFYKTKIRATNDFKKVNEYRRMFYGRSSSAMKQMDKHLKIIESARRIMHDFPSIKDGIFTVAIAGFPNVGKSTLLAKLSGASPEIAPYAFTTKSMNIGYIKKDGKRVVQLIDTPGTLNRLEKMNNMEKQSYIAIKHAADLIVYVFDPTETYSMEEQEKLLERIKEETGKKVIVYISKTDVKDIDKEGTRSYQELLEELLTIKSERDLQEQDP